MLFEDTDSKPIETAKPHMLQARSISSISCSLAAFAFPEMPFSNAGSYQSSIQSLSPCSGTQPVTLTLGCPCHLHRTDTEESKQNQRHSQGRAWCRDTNCTLHGGEDAKLSCCPSPPHHEHSARAANPLPVGTQTITDPYTASPNSFLQEISTFGQFMDN